MELVLVLEFEVSLELSASFILALITFSSATLTGLLLCLFCPFPLQLADYGRVLFPFCHISPELFFGINLTSHSSKHFFAHDPCLVFENVAYPLNIHFIKIN
jgi:hypothetical protein